MRYNNPDLTYGDHHGGMVLNFLRSKIPGDGRPPPELQHNRWSFTCSSLLPTINQLLCPQETLFRPPLNNILLKVPEGPSTPTPGSTSTCGSVRTTTAICPTTNYSPPPSKSHNTHTPPSHHSTCWVSTRTTKEMSPTPPRLVEYGSLSA